MSSDRYFTLAGESTGEVREKASKFFAYAFPIADEEDFKKQQVEITRTHHTARHICHAWVLGDAGEQYRSYDAGEPSGSAGKPILRQLQGAISPTARSWWCATSAEPYWERRDYPMPSRTRRKQRWRTTASWNVWYVRS
ncbi:MAG: YigZ family protein [Flavobacteriales bacterium]|nr:YigZ family protein [Flavobacteriales bacterium]